MMICLDVSAMFGSDNIFRTTYRDNHGFLKLVDTYTIIIWWQSFLILMFIFGRRIRNPSSWNKVAIFPFSTSWHDGGLDNNNDNLFVLFFFFPVPSFLLPSLPPSFLPSLQPHAADLTRIRTNVQIHFDIIKSKLYTSPEQCLGPSKKYSFTNGDAAHALAAVDGPSVRIFCLKINHSFKKFVPPTSFH